MTLAEFVLARIAEREAAIRARDPQAPIHTIGCYYYFSSLEDFEKCDCDEDGALSRRALAECEARRRVLDLADNAFREAATGGEWPVRQFFDGRASLAEAMLRALALPDADHPDFDEAWRP